MKFETTADLRPSIDTSLPQFAARYALGFLALILSVVLIDMFFLSMPLARSNPFGGAVMCGMIATLPREPPRYLSLRRFGLGMCLGATLGILVAAFGPIELGTPLAVTASVIGYSFVGGAILSVHFLWHCLLTPGRD